MKCTICTIREADKTGSHIIPHFILESMNNAPGVSGRDKGISFQIGKTSVDIKFGRENTPEALEEALGRPATGEEIDASIKEQDFVEDHIFCSHCEKRLSTLESLYKSEIDTLLQTGKEISPERLQIANFFWLTVILRCSLSKKIEFKLSPGEEESVRKTIDDTISLTTEETRQNCIQKSFPLRLKLFHNYSLADKTRNCVFITGYKTPYLLFINNYILLFNYVGKPQIEELQNEFGIRQEVNESVITNVDNASWERVIHYCFSQKSKITYPENVERFVREFEAQRGIKPSASQTKLYMTELVDDNSVNEVDRYKVQRIANLLRKHIYQA